MGLTRLKDAEVNWKKKRLNFSSRRKLRSSMNSREDPSTIFYAFRDIFHEKSLKVPTAMAQFFQQQLTHVILWLWLFVFYFGLQHHVPFRLSKYNLISFLHE